MIRVRVLRQRCSSPPQQGQTSRRCSTCASIFAGVGRREPSCPAFAPGLLPRRFFAAGFWYTGTMPEGVDADGCNRAIRALAANSASRTASGPAAARAAASSSLSRPCNKAATRAATSADGCVAVRIRDYVTTRRQKRNT